MPGRLFVALCAALLAFSPALAAAPKPAPKAAASPAPAPTAPAAPTNARVVWGGIGYYNVSVTINTNFGSFSNSAGAFGINGGGAFNVAQLGTDVPLALWGNVALGFPSGFTILPFSVGAAARYDKLPVQLLGGLGFTLMPQPSGPSTVAGGCIQAIGLIPLPDVNRNFSLQFQIAYHILSNSEQLFTLTGGVGWAI